MKPENQDQEKDPYEFILETEEPYNKPLYKRLSKKQKLFIYSSLSVLLIGTLLLFVAVRNHENSLQKARLLSVAQTQTEIIRIASLGEKQEGQESKDRASKIREDIEADLEKITEALDKRKTRVDDPTLSAKKNNVHDSLLVEAILKNSFDQAFNDLMDDQLFEYQRLLLEAQQKGSSEERKILQEAYDKANDLLGLEDEQ
jgi:hypothetical protein